MFDQSSNDFLFCIQNEWQALVRIVYEIPRDYGFVYNLSKWNSILLFSDFFFCCVDIYDIEAFVFIDCLKLCLAPLF